MRVPTFLRRALPALAALAALGMAAAPAAAQGFPNKPVTLINPYPPGGFADSVARVIAQEAGRILVIPEGQCLHVTVRR